MKLDDEIIKFLSLYDDKVYQLAVNLRSFLVNTLPDIEELLDTKARIIGYGYGPGYKDNICAILLSKKGVKLGINRGSELADPSRLLKGSGKVHKYVEINSDKDLKSAALRKILSNALRAFELRKNII